MHSTREMAICISSVPLRASAEARGVASKAEAQYRAFRSRRPGTVLIRPRCTSGLGRLIEVLVRGSAAAISWSRAPIYVRYDSYTALLILILGVSGRVLVAEVNGCLTAEVSGWKRWLQTLCDHRCLPYAPRIIAVAEDVRSYVLEAIAGSRRKPVVVVIGNAVEVPKHHVPRIPDDNPTLFYLGTYRPWHGLDFLLDALSAKSLDGARLVLAGTGPEEMTIRRRVEELGLQERVRFLGWVGEDELPGVLATADLGIGSLALERAGLRTAAVLKVRSYLAHGLPTIVEYEEDPDTMRQSFVFRVSGDHDGLAGQIADALRVCRLRGDEIRLAAWEYARGHFSYEAWVSQVFGLIENTF